MGLSTERKVFIAVLAVAGAALVIDRGFLGPSQASASSGLPVETPVSEGELVPATTSTAKAPESMARILMQRIEGIESQSGDHSLSAAFSLEKFMKPKPVEQERQTGERDSDPSSMLNIIVADTPDLPALTAVMPSTNGGGAVLNGKLVRVGDTIPGGFKLIEVRERSVVLELDGGIYPIQMPMQNRP